MTGPFRIAVRYRARWLTRPARSRPSAVAEGLMAEARGALIHVGNGQGAGIFLPSGGRLSTVAGELVVETPECTHPAMAVLHVRAGEATLLELADRAGGGAPGAIAIERVPGGWREEYFGREVADDVADRLVPYLASRVVLAGEGGFDPARAELRFVGSPTAFRFDGRMTRLVEVHRSSRRRQSIAAAWWFGIATSENLGTDEAAVLSLGANALVAWCAARADRFAPGLALKQPLRAWRAFAADSTGFVRAPLRDGRKLSALEIQRGYLDLVESHAQDLPSWAPAWCNRWRAAIDRFPLGGDSPVIEWRTKMARLEARIRAEPDWQTLSAWDDRWAGVAADLHLDPNPEQPDAAGEALAGWAAARGMSGDGLVKYHRLRAELLSIEAGLRRVRREDRAAPGARFDWAAVEWARGTPPADTRAAVRGKWVRRLGATAERSRFRCDWDGLHDLVAGTAIDLSDPTTTVAEWQTPVRTLQADLFSGIKDWFTWDF